jgi:oligosaccharide reducing-end xylanase
MKKLIPFFIFILLITNGMNLRSQAIDAPYEVAVWYDFTEAAISYTFDDGCRNQFDIAVPLFNEYNFKLTLFIVPAWLPDWDGVRAAADEGHEVACHTVTHTSFADLSPEGQEKELKESQAIINRNVPGWDCNTMAYPYCVAGDEELCRKYYIAARGCQGYIEASTPRSYLNISSINCGEEGTMTTLDAFVDKFTEAGSSGGWCVFLLHGLDERNDGYSPLSSDVLRKSLEYLDANRNTFWVTTFRNAVLYSKERDAVSIKETSFSEDLITLEVSDDLDNSIYNLPVSIRRPLPVGWSQAIVKQNDKVLKSEIREIKGTNYILFEAIPDNGKVFITKAKKKN